MTLPLRYLLLALGLVLATSAAAPVAAQEPQEERAPAHASSADDFRAGLAKARISLAEAVLRANRVVAGDVLAAHLDTQRKEGALPVEFQVLVLRDGELWEVHVDAVSGWVAGVEKMGLLDELGEHEYGHEHGEAEEHVDAETGERLEWVQRVEHVKDPAPPPITTEALTMGFEDPKPGTLPAHFAAAETNGAGHLAPWSVVRDNAAAKGAQAIQVKSANQGQTFNLLLSDTVHPANLELAVKIRADEGQEDQGGGLLWRARNAKNYYIARWNPLERNLRIYKVEDGRRTQLQSADVEARGSTVWHTLGVRVQGTKMRVDFDGQPLLEIEDTTFTAPGRVGLWTKADASCSFDEFAIHPLR